MIILRRRLKLLPMENDLSDQAYSAATEAFKQASLELYKSIDDVIKQDIVALDPMAQDIFKVQGIMEIENALRSFNHYASELIDPKEIAVMALENCDDPYCDTTQSLFPHNQRFIEAVANVFTTGNTLKKFPQHKNLGSEDFY